ncbi:MAG TPA: phospholipase D family protein [Albitalea sp.]|nr:phospholipase D family protein [Albitalea sp.]
MSGFEILDNGRAAFVMRAALADAAERSIDLQYYSAGDDLTSTLLLQRIVAAADRGVRVRILLDDMQPSTRVFARRAMAAHAGIEVRVFNPFLSGTSNVARLGEFLVDGARLNRRMHNKLWLTDNSVAVAGSRNLGDEYFDSNASFNLLDVDVLAVGPVVQALSKAFDVYWNSAVAIRLDALVGMPEAGDRAAARRDLQARTAGCAARPPCQWLAERELQPLLRAQDLPLSWARAEVIVDPPEHAKIAPNAGIAHGATHDHPGGDHAETEVLIVSPYFVPDADLHGHVSALRERGVRVAVLTNSLASVDVPSAHAGYARHRPALLHEGVELYEVRPKSGAMVRRRLVQRWGHASAASLHAKVIVQDRARVSVGSVNQDPRSRLHNTEQCIVIESAGMAAQLSALFDEATDPQEAFRVELRSTGERGDALRWTTQDGDEVIRYDTEPLSTAWQRLWRGILGAVIPEHDL